MEHMFDGLFGALKFFATAFLVLLVALLIVSAPSLMSGATQVTHRHESIDQRVTEQKFCEAALKKCPHITQLHQSNFMQMIADKSQPVVACYYVDSSPLCAQQLEILEKVAAADKTNSRFVAGDVAEFPRTCNVLNLKQVPAIVVVAKGNKPMQIKQLFLQENELSAFVKTATAN